MSAGIERGSLFPDAKARLIVTTSQTRTMDSAFRMKSQIELLLDTLR